MSNKSSTSPAPSLAAAPVVASRELNASALQMWLAEAVAGAHGAYNIPVAWQVVGPLDVEALRMALTQLTQRHEALSSVVLEDAGTVRRLRRPELSLQWQSLDMRGLGQAALDEAIRAASQQRFMLASELPLRALLLRESEDAHRLLVVVHHVAGDGGSMAVIARELQALYEARVGNKLLRLPDEDPEALERVARRDALSEDAARTYWHALLPASCPELPLPLDRASTSGPGRRGDSVPFASPSGLAQAVDALRARRGATPFGVLAAALAGWLSRITGAQDLCIAYPVARRRDPGLADLVGCLMNTVVLRVQLTPADNFLTLLNRVQASLQEARPHQGLPFNEIVASGTVRVLLNLNPNDTPPLALHGLAVERLPRVSTGAPFDLAWICAGTEGEIRGRLEFNEDRFERSTAARLARQFLEFLDLAVQAPEQPLSRLPLVSDEERAALLAQGTGEALQEGGEAVVDVYGQLVAAAKREPQALALWCEGRGLSHGALHVRAGALAQRLRELGLGSQDRVALCLPRSLAHAVAVVGALRAGVAFVPLDVQAPEARLQLQLQEVRASLVLSTPALQGRVPAQVRCLCLQEDGRLQEVPEEAPAEGAQAWEALGPAPQVHPRQLAYVLFTSGSTGRPKGVAVDVGALGSHLAACVKRYELQAQDRVLQFAASTFDTAIEQLLAPLCAGASVYLRGEAAWSPDEMMEFVKAQGLTVVDMPTAYWHLLSGEAKLAQARSLRLVVAGGEAALAARSRQAPAGVRSLNAYGPTEATVTCCMGPLAGAAAGAGPWVPIGKPLPGTQVYVLDAALNLVPQGVAGQLYVAGERVARGYLGQPGLTARQFVPDPYGEPGRRMYATGDVVRWLEGGTLEYLGRADQQLKIRGVRIEPGEIEQALSAVAGVRQSVVVAQEEADGERSLAAYVVGEAGLTGQGLREQLQGRLPQALLPTHWSFLESLPLTPHGKVDRKRLPAITVVAAPVADGAGRASGAEGPANDTATQLLALVRRLAGHEGIGLDDALADHGFHSLKLVRLSSDCAKAFGVAPGLRQLFRAGTVRRIAAHLDAAILETQA
ncbi:non-ribosomal peptide synthetase [Roseateles sp. BYS96W]|uniref:Amino acid adenylation domain-containing protein n=1 Tax=Pelomonas nitida TaxID=3299027 RepID=A0ABW7GCX6_9BURK